MALASVAGCLNSGSSDGERAASDGRGPLKQVDVEGTSLVVELTGDAAVDQINLIQPDGEQFETREVAAGVQQVSFEIGTDYEPGEYRIVGLKNGTTAEETATDIQPEIRIRDVGLFRNNPDKSWDEIYGDTETNRLKNGEAFVTVENTGTGPETVVELVFAGGVPNPIENPRGSGIYETEQVVVPPGETEDLFSGSFPFGSKSQNGVGCSPDTRSDQFTVIVETGTDNKVRKTFDVEYSGSNEISDCQISISEA